MATKKNVRIGNREYYRIRRTIDGKQKSFYGSSKGDAENKYKRFLEEQAEKKVARKTEHLTATIHDRAKEYIENSLSVSQKYARGTKVSYRSAYNVHVKGSELDRMVASDVRAKDIQRFYNDLDISSQGLSQVNKFLSAFWKWMVLNQYADDVFRAVELPIKPDNSRNDGIVIWTDEEVSAILGGIDAVRQPCKPFRASFIVKVLLYTGMRIGEALSLKYSDVRDGMIHIDRQLYLGEIKPPKYNSARIVPLHDALAVPLAEHREWHRREMERREYLTDYVFTTKNGTLYEPTNIRKLLNAYYDKIGVPKKSIHTYRHTFCTQLCRCDVPLEVASKLLGHKSLEVTARHYQLIKNDTLEDAIGKLHYDS